MNIQRMSGMNDVVRFLPLLLLLAGTAFFLGICFAFPSAWTLDVGTGGDRHFLANFSIAEKSQDTTFRWSQPSSRLMLHGSTRGVAVLALRLHGDERALQDDWYLGLQSPQQTLATMRIHPGWRVYHVLLPRGVMAGERMEVAPLRLVSDTYRQETGDNRKLGVALDWLRIAPLEPSSFVHAFARSLMLVWVLALLAMGVWMIDKRLFCLPRRTAPLRVSLLVAPVSLLFLWLAWRNLHTLAWALPPTPWMLGLGTLLATQWRMKHGAWRMPGNAPRFLISAFHSPFPALSLLVVAQILFHTRWMVIGGIVAACGGIVLLANRNPVCGKPVSGQKPCAFFHAPFSIVLVFLLALVLRYYRLDELPYGLWRDEARHGLLALRLLHDPTYRPVYEPAGVQLPVLGLYPFALALKLWGIHLWSMRAITALAGSLTVFPLYGLVVYLSRRHDVALLAAAFLAVSSWHITLSRFSFPTVFEPLLTLTALWLMVVAFRARLRSSPVPFSPRTLMVKSGQEPRITRITRIDAVVETLHATSLPPKPHLPSESPREKGSSVSPLPQDSVGKVRPIPGSAGGSPAPGRGLAPPNPYRITQTTWTNRVPQREGHGVRAVPGDENPATSAPRGNATFPALRMLLACLLAGVCLGAAAQTYHTGRLAPALAALLALFLFFQHRQHWQQRESVDNVRPDAGSAGGSPAPGRDLAPHSGSTGGSSVPGRGLALPNPYPITKTPWASSGPWLAGMLVLGISFLVTVGPLLSYGLQHREEFNRRVNKVFLLGEDTLEGRAPLASLDASLGRHGLMFNVQGDDNGRHHAPGQPMLDFVTGLGFLAGCAVVLRRWADWRMRWLVLALAIGLVSSLLAADGPHAMRSIGAAGFACAIAALGWREIAYWMGDRWFADRGAESTQNGQGSGAWFSLHRFRPLVFVLPVLLALLLNVWIYFVVMPAQPAVWLSSYPIHSQMGVYLRDMAEEKGSDALEQVYVHVEMKRNAVFHYLAYNLPVQTFDGRSLSRPATEDALFVLSGYNWQREVQTLAPYLGSDPEPVLVGPLLPDGETRSFVVYQRKP
jgi:hypothetical protein